MAGEKAGYDFQLKVKLKGASAFTLVGGLQSVSLSTASGEVETTNMGSNRWRELLNNAGTVTVSLSGSGVFNTSTTLTQVASDVLTGALREFQLVDADSGQVWTGMFKVTSWERTGEHDGMQAYSLSLSNSGPVVVS